MVKLKRRKVDSEEKGYRNASVEFVSCDVSGVPYCEHGPTMLLEKLKGGSVEKFFACSVCRSRKDCKYYRSYDVECRHPTSSQKIEMTKNIMKTKRGLSHKELYNRLKTFRKTPPEKRRFCADCSRLLLNAEEEKHHEPSVDGRQHEVMNGISDKQLRNSSRLVKLSQNAKKEAQFLFSRQSLTFIAESVKKFGFDGVLCIGTPTLKEFLHKLTYRRMCKSFLLDIDYRYAQFWSPRFYAQFSMFNGYFYTSLGEKCYRDFLSNVNKLLIVVDPPFGGLIAPLAQTLLRLKMEFETGGRSCDVMLVSPYFMERKICSAIPNMAMLDYKVTYNETNGLIGDDASHIRIFTTMKPELVELPSEFGYRFCEHCKRYVAPENRHCQACNSCTSKDGRPYAHCDKCSKCVKSRYSHCEKCNHCHKKTNGCRSTVQLCQLCGEAGHAWVHCPKKEQAGDVEKGNTKRESNGTTAGSVGRGKAKSRKVQTTAKSHGGSKESRVKTGLKRKLSF